MLVLTRRVGESLKIGHDIHLVVMGVKGSHVRIGVEAPREVAVYREEIYRLIQKATEGESSTEETSEIESEPPR